MPIAVTCQCGKTLNVRDDLAGKAVKCPACQQVIRIAAATPKPATAGPAAVRPPAATPTKPAATPNKPAATAARPAPAAAVRMAPAPQPTQMDHLFEEAGFAVKTGLFCPECAHPLSPGAVLCTQCGYHIESGSKLQGYTSTLEDHDSAEAQLRHAEYNMKRAKELDDRLQAAGMPAWVMALVLFILASCTAVGVIAVNVARRGKDSDVSFNAVATMLLLAGIAFVAVAIGSYCVVIARAFKVSPKDGMFVLLIPFYVYYFAFKHFKKVGVTLIVSMITAGIAGGLFVLAGMSNAGQL